MARNDVSSSETERYQNRAVIRALDVLWVLSQFDEPASLNAIATATGLHPTTTLRMLHSLRARDFVRQGADGRYALGVGTLDLASRYLRAVPITRFAQDVVGRLAKEARETASIGVLVEGEVLYVAIAEGQRELGIQSVPLSRHPVHCTALGKALLAHRPWPDAALIFEQHPPTRQTERTILEADALRAELALTAARGYAIDNEERIEGVMCIGAPIRDHTAKTVAAISISGPSFRVAHRGTDRLGAIVLRYAHETSRLLGAPPAVVASAPELVAEP